METNSNPSPGGYPAPKTYELDNKSLPQRKGRLGTTKTPGLPPFNDRFIQWKFGRGVDPDMSQVNVQRTVQRTEHARALLSGGLGVFASLLAIGWALFAYNLPSAFDLTTKMSQNLMLLQVGVAFVTLLGSGLMLARYTVAGGLLNIVGSLSTFITGIYYSSGLEAAARAKDLTTLHLQFAQYYTGTVNIPTDRIVSTVLVVPVLPIALLLLISGLGAIATYRAGKKPMLLPQK